MNFSIEELRVGIESEMADAGDPEDWTNIATYLMEDARRGSAAAIRLWKEYQNLLAEQIGVTPAELFRQVEEELESGSWTAYDPEDELDEDLYGA